MPDDTPIQPPLPGDLDGTLRQTDEAVGKTRDLSIPTGVEQQANAPRIAGYVLTALLGQGAYAQVWRAWQVRTRKWVAVKCFLARGAVNWMLLQREMERLIRLDKHPHIVSLLDADLTADPAWYALDLLEAGSLEQYVDPRKLVGVDRAAKWMEEVAEALSYVHSKGIIHCDLKPANVLLDDMGHARVADFGQSRVLSESAGALGTLFFMAPEQAVVSHGGQAAQPDVRWDVYALGASAYAVLTGKVPNMESLRERLTTSPGLEDRLNAYRELTRGAVLRSAREVRGPIVDEDLSAIVGKCLAYDPDQRYGTMGAVLGDLAARRESRPVTPLADRRGYVARKFLRRNLAMVVTVALAAVGLTAAVVRIAVDRQSMKLQLARSYAVHARHYVDKGDMLAALANYAESYRLAPTALARRNALAFLPAVATPRFIVDDAWEMKVEGSGRPQLSPDGKRLLTVSKYYTVRMRDMASGALVGKPMPHKLKVWDVSFSPDGTRILTCGEEKAVFFWDARTGEPVGKPLVQEGEVYKCAWSRDGKLICVYRYDYTKYASVGQVWDLATGRPVGKTMSFEGWCGGVFLVAFASSDEFVVSAGVGGAAMVWNARTGDLVRRLPVSEGGMRSVVLSPDGTRLAVADANVSAVRIWDVRTGKQVAVIQQGDWQGVRSFSPDGRRVITNDNVARVWDAATGKLIGKPMPHEWGVTAGSFSPDGRRIVTASFDGTARVWDAATQEQIGPALYHEGPVQSADFSTDGGQVMTAGTDGSARVWDLSPGGSPPAAFRVHGGMLDASQDGRRMLVARYVSAAVYDTVAGRRVGRFMCHSGEVLSGKFSPDGARVVTGDYHGSVRLWDAGTGEPVGAIMWNGTPVGVVAFSPDGTRIATGDQIGNVRIWDGRTGQLVVETKISHGRAVMNVEFSPDGSRIVTAGGWDGTARLWDARTGVPTAPAIELGWYVAIAQFSPDGRYLAVTTSASDKAPCWIVNVRTGQPRAKLATAKQVIGLRMHPAGRAFLTHDTDFEVRAWDIATGDALGKPMRHGGRLADAAFSPDGSSIATIGEDGNLRLWDSESGEPVGPSLPCGVKPKQVVFRGSSEVAVATEDSVRVLSVPWASKRISPDDLQLDVQVVTHRRLDRFGAAGIVPVGEWRPLADRWKSREGRQ